MADTCPKCGHTDGGSDKCPSCGVIIPLYRAYLDKLYRRTPHTESAPAPTADPPVSAVTSGSRRFTFHGDIGTLLGIQMVNSLLIILTLGVYFFWARVRVRRYLLSETELEGDRFAFHGTGKELALGGLKAAVVFGVPLVIVTVVGLIGERVPLVDTLGGFASTAIVVTFAAVVIAGGRRYRLRRTAWRGIRFSFRGSMREFLKLFVVGSIVVILSFGLYIPTFFTRQYGYLTSNSWFGNRPFGFDGRPEALFWPYVKALALGVPTLGLCFFWYLAQQQRYFWGHTTFDGARFRSTATGGGLLGLHGVNFLALGVTLGLAWPWVVMRKWRYRLDNLRLEGPLDVTDIVQQPRAVNAAVDSMAGLIDVDFG